MSVSPEADLIARCRKGDSMAWDALFDQYYASTARFVFQLSSDLTREDVEEVCQETFLAVVRNLNSFRGTSQLQTWIFRIASNKARDYRQRLSASKRGGGVVTVSLQGPSDGSDQPLDVPSPIAGPDVDLLRREQVLMVSQGLDRLGDSCREVIELRYFGDLSYDEISAELNLNPKTVSSRLSKCLDSLEAILNGIFSGKDSSNSSV
jgi:RNA polymerase sigma-70 factor (ECF subfamily)